MDDMLKNAVAKMQKKNGYGDMESGMKKGMKDNEDMEATEVSIDCPHCGKGIMIEIDKEDESKKDE